MVLGGTKYQGSGENYVMRNLTICPFSPNINRVTMSWAGHVARMGESIGAYRVLVGKPEGKRQFGRPGRRWEENTEMDLHEVGWGHGLNRIGSG